MLLLHLVSKMWIRRVWQGKLTHCRMGLPVHVKQPCRLSEHVMAAAPGVTAAAGALQQWRLARTLGCWTSGAAAALYSMSWQSIYQSWPGGTRLLYPSLPGAQRRQASHTQPKTVSGTEISRSHVSHQSQGKQSEP
jgi:hypothetical protein